MICPNCGFENRDDARFCKQCGAPQDNAQQSVPPQPASVQPPVPFSGVNAAAAKKRSKVGLIIGICAGVLVIVGAALALLFLLPGGSSVQGYWVAEDAGLVLSLDEDGELTMYSLTGTAEAGYDFDKSSGEGSFKEDGVKYRFTVDGDSLDLTNGDTDQTVTFSRVEDEPDIEEIVTAQLIGNWTNEDGSVIELKQNGDIILHTSTGDQSGKFEFDADDGEGACDFGYGEAAFTCDGAALTFGGDVVYTKAAGDLDIQAFVQENGNPLLCMWYDVAGVNGTLEFYGDGTFTYTCFGMPYNGTYTYNGSLGSGTFESVWESLGGFSYSDGELVFDGVTYTRDFVEQHADPNFVLEGTWIHRGDRYSNQINFDYGNTLWLFINDGFYYGTYEYNADIGSGYITAEGTSSGEFRILAGGVFYDGEYYTRFE
jgi:hypothetical protein